MAKTASVQPFSNRLSGSGYTQQNVANLYMRYNEFVRLRDSLKSGFGSAVNVSNQMNGATKEGLVSQLEDLKKIIQDTRELSAHPDVEFTPKIREEIMQLTQSFQAIYAEIYNLSM